MEIKGAAGKTISKIAYLYMNETDHVDAGGRQVLASRARVNLQNCHDGSMADRSGMQSTLEVFMNGTIHLTTK